MPAWDFPKPLTPAYQSLTSDAQFTNDGFNPSKFQFPECLMIADCFTTYFTEPGICWLDVAMQQ